MHRCAMTFTLYVLDYNLFNYNQSLKHFHIPLNIDDPFI